MIRSVSGIKPGFVHIRAFGGSLLVITGLVPMIHVRFLARQEGDGGA
jgi:hypothetical protein